MVVMVVVIRMLGMMEMVMMIVMLKMTISVDETSRVVEIRMKTITMKRHLLIRVYAEGDNQLTKLPLLIMEEMVEMVEYRPEPLKRCPMAQGGSPAATQFVLFVSLSLSPGDF